MRSWGWSPWGCDKRARDQSLPSPCNVRIQREGGCLQACKRASPDSESASTLILNVSDSRTVRHNCLLLKPHRLWYFVQQPELGQLVVLFLHLTTYETEEREHLTKQKGKKRHSLRVIQTGIIIFFSKVNFYKGISNLFTRVPTFAYWSARLQVMY